MNQEPVHIGLLHPGAMGVSIGASAQNSGNVVYWVAEGRSSQTKERAQNAGLTDAGTLPHLCEQCSMIISVCPPAAAEDVADEVIATGFRGLFVDANAIAPQRAVRIGEKLAANGIAFVDGGIIGGPAWKPNATWLHLSGEYAAQVARYFEGGLLETRIVSDKIGDASALKMCYAAYTKGTTALLAAILGTAESLNVRAALEQQWSQDDTAFVEETHHRVRNVTAKAWRFAGEMEEIAATFEAAGFPGGFHNGANNIYLRLAEFKDAPQTPSLEAVLLALLNGQE
jgi:3-hydroxyisobutyrate dehydrogenase-like beta-hydroxyacid dehydrogenase